MCIMSQSQLRESASVWSHRVSGGVRAVFQRFWQCLDSQAFVLSCHPYEASPDYEKGFSGHPKRLFRAVIRCFLLCGGGVLGMRESLSGSAVWAFTRGDTVFSAPDESAEEPFRALSPGRGGMFMPFSYVHRHPSVSVLRKSVVKIFYFHMCIFMQYGRVFRFVSSLSMHFPDTAQ